MTPKILLKYIPDSDLRKIVLEVLSWHEKGVRSGNELDRLAQMLVTDCNLSEEGTDLLQIAETLVLGEAARRFAEEG